MQKTLDEKLRRIQADRSCRDFILADAKDGDMGFGIACPGPSGDERLPFHSLQDYRENMRRITKSGLVDIMLMSASSSEQLTIVERIFDGTGVTPAVRANDTTDIWLGLSGGYGNEASRAFRSASIDHIQSGRWKCSDEERSKGANLGLYSITFNNDRDLDLEAVTVHRDF